MTVREQIEQRLTALETNDSSNDLQIQIEQLQEQLAAFAEPVTLEADTTPVWTERINIDSTVKDGYRVKEATVTVQNAGGDEQTREERRRRIAEAIEDGQAVAEALNSQRDQVNRFR